VGSTRLAVAEAAAALTAAQRVTFDVPEKEPINGVPSATLFLWTIPAKVSGRWQKHAADSASTRTQKFAVVP
jgi:hypothetical protein